MISPDVLRHIDRLAGVPACALLTALRRLVPRRGAQQGAIRRVLFVQLAESGSMVLADPALRELARRTGARLYCATFAANRGSLALTGTVPQAQVITLRASSPWVLALDAWRLLRWARRAGIDTVIDGELFSRLTAVLCLLTGVRRRAGFHRSGGSGLYRGDLYTHPVAFDGAQHMARNYMMLARAVLPSVPAAALADPRLVRRPVAPEPIAAVRETLASRLAGPLPARLVLVNPNASDLLPQRRWPPERFEALVRALLARYGDARVLLIGADADRACTSAIAHRVAHPRCTDVAGLFPLESLPALFTLSAVLVSNDSGPAHFASVTGLPTVVLFGPETPRLFRPLGAATVISAGLACSPCVHVGNQRRSRCRDNQCMQRIDVAEVLHATCRVLDAQDARAGAEEIAA